MSVIGRLGAVTEKYFVELEAALMVREAVPEFVAVMDKVLLDPTVTLPKSSFVEASERVPKD